MKLLKIKNNKGFTIVELMIVMAIIALLSIVLIPKIGFAPNKAKETGVITDFRSFEMSLEAFKTAQNRLPNFKEFQDSMKKDFTFNMTQAKVREEGGQKFITIRVETTKPSPFNCPYGVTFITLYQGSESDGYEFNLETDREILENDDRNNVVSVIVDCIKSSENPMILIK